MVKKKHLIPTETGLKLCDFLVARFPQVFDVGYTARLEVALDRVASGEMKRSDLLETFWRGFQPKTPQSQYKSNENAPFKA